MKKIGSAVLAALFLVCLFCHSPASAADSPVRVEDPSIYQRFQGQNVTINVYNWGEYISDGSNGSLAVNKAFERLSGVKVNYTTFASNEELYAKLKTGGAMYDVIIPSDYMISRMIAEEMLEPIDFANVPNISMIDEPFQNPAYDPQNAYSAPYTWGTVGVIYNTRMVDEEDIGSWDLLWNEKYLGDILMFSNSRDALAISEKRLGYSFNTTDPEEIGAAFEELKKQKPLVQAYVMDEIFDKMQGGEAAIAPYYAGDAIVMLADNPDLAYYVPEEGTNLFTDAMCIPKGAPHKEAAELYINFMLETEVAAANSAYIGYSTPQKFAKLLLDEETASNPIAYPTEAVLSKAESFQNLPPSVSSLIDAGWTNLMSAHSGQEEWFIPVFLIACIGAMIAIQMARSLKKRRNYY